MRLRLDEIIKEMGITQADLAERTGLSRQSINRLVNNPRQVRLSTLEALIKELDVEINKLFKNGE